MVTIVTRFGLAVLIFGTDIVLARLLGPAAKGRFALVLLYSQLAAVVVGWGMDSALAVAGENGPLRLARFAHAGGASETFRSVIHFDAEERSAGRPSALAGRPGIERYLSRGSGRLKGV